MLKDTVNKVRWCAMIKLIIIILICAIQILIIKGFFKGSDSDKLGGSVWLVKWKNKKVTILFENLRHLFTLSLIR